MAITSKPRQINVMKIEFDIPEFKRELKIEITLKRDGEVIYQEASSLPEFTAEDIVVDNKVDNKTMTKKASARSKATGDSTTTKTSGGSISGRGNMMNIEEL